MILVLVFYSMIFSVRFMPKWTVYNMSLVYIRDQSIESVESHLQHYVAEQIKLKRKMKYPVGMSKIHAAMDVDYVRPR